MIAYCYANGQGGFRDYDIAVDMAKRAAEMGSDLAQYELTAWFFYGTKGLDIDFKMARRYDSMNATILHQLDMNHSRVGSGSFDMIFEISKARVAVIPLIEDEADTMVAVTAKEDNGAGDIVVKEE